MVRRGGRIRAIEKVTILAVVKHLLGGIPAGITTVDVVEGRECISPAIVPSRLALPGARRRASGA